MLPHPALHNLLALSLVLAAPTVLLGQASSADIPRMPDGRPDLSGTYDTATLTPLSRPKELGDTLFYTDEEAQDIAAKMARRRELDNQVTDPDREAPPEGGVDETIGGFRASGAAGRVGGYNNFWVDPGEGAFKIDGKWRTSIIVDPPDGQRPPLTEEARARAASRRGFYRPNTGEAWWIDMEVGPYDDMELRPLAERCLLGFGSTAGPPMLPTLYNNHKRLVQTEDHLMILTEMVHDVRIVRIDDEHDPPEIKKWLGDSVGHWEGDTLVVETVHFGDKKSFSSGSDQLRVIERFRRADDGTLIYHFTIDDPKNFTRQWSGEYPWPATDDKIYEYACHEGNYALGGILRGARLLEAEALAAQGDSSGGGAEDDGE